jgi:hypothetical protein
MGLTSSLRAQRGNPAVERATGLLRRFAPRNDEIILRGFVSSCEIIFAHEATKAQRRDMR